jgi:hypothetical protein
MQEAIEKAIGQVTSEAPQGTPEVAPKAEATPETPAAAQVVTPASGQVEQPKATPPEAPKEWDEDVNKLPPELQEWAKKVQRSYTKKSMFDAELKRHGEEFKKFVSGDEFQSFQQWRQSQTNGQVARPQTGAQPQSNGITAQEWEDAQLDGTGQKFNALVSRQVQAGMNQLVQQYKQDREVANYQTALSDFADAHPDVLELHSMGLMKTKLDEELARGVHNTYESAITAAYEAANGIRERVRQAELQRAQGRVQAKKDAVVHPGTTTGEENITYADDKQAAFDKAIENAMGGKKTKVKVK